VGEDLQSGGVNFSIALETLQHWLSSGEVLKENRDVFHSLLKMAMQGLETRMRVVDKMTSQMKDVDKEVRRTYPCFEGRVCLYFCVGIHMYTNTTK
jgi:hypothetical protein